MVLGGGWGTVSMVLGGRRGLLAWYLGWVGTVAMVLGGGWGLLPWYLVEAPGMSERLLPMAMGGGKSDCLVQA